MPLLTPQLWHWAKAAKNSACELVLQQFVFPHLFLLLILPGLSSFASIKNSNFFSSLVVIFDALPDGHQRKRMY